MYDPLAIANSRSVRLSRGVTQPFRLPPLSSLPFPPLSFLLLPSPFTRVRGITHGKIFGIKDVGRRVLEHFGHKN